MKYVIYMLVFVIVTTTVYSVDMMMSIQGTAYYDGIKLSGGHVRVYIYDNKTGGNLIYDSGTDFNNEISNGRYDVILGNGTNKLTLDYGNHYYLDISMDGNDLDFGSEERQLFPSWIGMINETFLNITDLEITTLNTSEITTTNLTTKSVVVSGNITTPSGTTLKLYGNNSNGSSLELTANDINFLFGGDTNFYSHDYSEAMYFNLPSKAWTAEPNVTMNIGTSYYWWNSTWSRFFRGFWANFLEINSTRGNFSEIITTNITTEVLNLKENSEPATPPANTLSLYVVDQDGFSRFNYKDELGVSRTLDDDEVIVNNSKASAIAAHRLVYVNGYDAGVPTVDLAKADSISTMPSICVTIESIAAHQLGRCMMTGLIQDVNTNAYDVGVIYVSDATAGVPTNTPPITPNLTQEIGSILVKDAAVGEIQILARALTGDEFGTINDFIVAGNLTVKGIYSLLEGSLNVTGDINSSQLTTTNATTEDLNVTDDARVLDQVMIGLGTFLGNLRITQNITNNSIYIDTYDNGGLGQGSQSIINLRRSDSDTIGTHDATQEGLGLGMIKWWGNQGVRFGEASQIRVLHNGSGGGETSSTMYLEASTSTAPNANQLVLHTGGNIGIGTNTPWSKLDVRGDVNCTELTTTNITLIGNQVCNATSCFTLQELNATNGMDYTNLVLTNKSNTISGEIEATTINGSFINSSGNIEATGDLKADSGSFVSWLGIGGDYDCDDQLTVFGTSNFTDDIKVQDDILPGDNISKDIGSTTNWWNKIYSNILKVTNITVVDYLSIGDDTPAEKLHVKGDIFLNTSNTYGPQITFNSQSTGSSGKEWVIGIPGSAESTEFFIYDSNSSTTRFFIQNGTGYTGINTATPRALLDVKGGNIIFEHTSLTFKLNATSGQEWWIQSHSDGSLYFYDRTNTAYRLQIDGSGNVKIHDLAGTGNGIVCTDNNGVLFVDSDDDGCADGV